MKLEDLARMVERGFEATASKQDLTALASKQDLADLEKRIQHQIDGIDLKISAYASRWTEDFEKLHDWVKEIDSRVRFVEKQVQK